MKQIIQSETSGCLHLGTGKLRGRMRKIQCFAGMVAVLSLGCTGYRPLFDVNSTTHEATLSAITCPTNYVLVPFNSAVGTTADFCVAKFEMKCAADTTGTACSGSALSQPSNRPWVNITQSAAITACNNLGSGYHLVTNPEWMTIARNAELVSANWSGGSVNSGTLNRGHSDSTPANTLAASTDDDGCSGTGQVCGNTTTYDNQRRTHQLSNGEVIWDFAGNAWEWSNYQILLAEKAYLSTDGGPLGVWREWNIIDTNIGVGSVMEPKTWQSTNPALTSANGIGMYQSGAALTPSAPYRGGSHSDGINGGLFAMALNFLATTPSPALGFRCVKQ